MGRIGVLLVIEGRLIQRTMFSWYVMPLPFHTHLVMFMNLVKIVHIKNVFRTIITHVACIRSERGRGRAREKLKELERDREIELRA